uniref:Carbon catabolite repressor protein putative n=1 Tax=Albugo laibachii Nc14 TaxID=890382 RepID=F0VZ48_9STRA|nr:carbon catabolite repressor protein putative [Albugo laibachii Nc14]|eukprot:CCA14063.1 carbon catabolite repressor protein putative [Albugo laibachii Nc14]
MQTSQVYVLDRVYEDLETPFVAKDIIRQLTQLDTIVNDIFHRLSHKVTHEKDRIRAIDSRITVCQAKVNAIIVLPDTQTLFHDKPYVENSPLLNDDEDAHYLPAKAVPIAQRARTMNEVVEMFEKVNAYREPKSAEVDMSKEGLGPLPDYISSVGNLLLFNSGENPYQKYTSWDNLLGTDYEEEDDKPKELAKAPPTLVHGDQLPGVSHLDYNFHPQMREVPEFSPLLPANLPLPNLANYNYAQTDMVLSIAPSLFQNKALLDLPEVATFMDGPTAFEPARDQLDVINSNAPPLPPPPPVLIEIEEDEENGVPPPPPPEMDWSSTMEDTPPPPPAIFDAVDAEDDEAVPLPPIEEEATMIDDQSKTNEPSEDDKKPLTMQDEMRKRLLRRQGVISGKADKQEQREERERYAKPVTVLKAKEVTPPAGNLPPKPMINQVEARDRLPSVEMSDDGHGIPRRNRPNAIVTDGDDNDLLAQIKSIRRKQEANPTTEAASRPTATNNGNPVERFESQMIGLHDDNDSLSLDSASDWSDE